MAVHEVGFKTAMTRVFNDYARRINELKDKDKNLDGNDIREGLTAIISVRIPEELLQFEGQTKSKLGTSEARSAVDSVVSEKLPFYLEEKGQLSKSLVKKQLKHNKLVKQHAKLVKMRALVKRINVKILCYQVN